MIAFTKMNGAGNDFVLLDNREENLHLSREDIERLCDRHRGVGADGVLVAEPPRDGGDFRMRYYNSDGGEAEMCGNGARCFARFAQKLADKGSSLKFETIAGTIEASVRGETVTLQMSSPHSLEVVAVLDVEGQSHEVSSINTGVPHAVVFVEDLEKVDVAGLGRALRHHRHFAPKGTNVNFAQVLSGGRLGIRTYERGVEGETLACGTGVVASAILFSVRIGVPPPIKVLVRGGDELEVDFERSGEDAFSGVTLRGPAEFVFEGSINL